MRAGYQAKMDLELEFWRAIKDGDDPSDFELYLEQFPRGIYVALAKRRLAVLKGRPIAVPAPGEVERDAAEAARREAEARAALDREQKEAAAFVAQRDAEILEQLTRKAHDPAWVRKVLDTIEAELVRLEAAAAAARGRYPEPLGHWTRELELVLQYSTAAPRMPLLQRFVAQDWPELLEAIRMSDAFGIRRRVGQSLALFRAGRDEGLAVLEALR
jgi:hypothetical protein